MTNDFGITERSTSSSYDQRWLASNHGLATGKSKMLDLTTLAGLRDSGGNLASGIAVGKITASGDYGLFDATATDGRQTLAGFILADINIVDSNGVVQKSGKAPFALLDRADIKTAYLPVVAQRTLTHETPNTGSFIFVTN